MLPERVDSERSWTVDIAARKKEAKRQSDPLRAEAERLSSEASQLRNDIKQLKGANGPAEQLEELQKNLGALDGKIRELNSKASSIDDMVYDLKAVNPNAKSEEDTRTPGQLLDFIEARGREIQAAIDALRLLTAQEVIDPEETSTTLPSLSVTDIKHGEQQRENEIERVSL